MRPKSVITFELLYIVAIVIGLASTLLNWDRATAPLEAANISPAILIGSIVFGLAITLVLVFLISRRASNIARWVLVVLYVVGIIMLIPKAGAATFAGTIGIVQIVQLVLQGIAILILFTRESNQWFARRGRATEADTFR